MLCSNAQSINRIWLGASVKKELIENWLDFELETGARSELHNGFYSFLLAPELSCTLSKYLDLNFGYRLSRQVRNYENRFSVGAAWQKKIIKRTYLSLKPRFQLDKATDSRIWERTARFKINIKRKIKGKKIYPYLFNEWFVESIPGYIGLKSTRIGTGISVKSIKRTTLKAGYFRSISLTGKTATNKNVIIFCYSYNLK